MMAEAVLWKWNDETTRDVPVAAGEGMKPLQYNGRRSRRGTGAVTRRTNVVQSAADDAAARVSAELVPLLNRVFHNFCE